MPPEEQMHSGNRHYIKTGKNIRWHAGQFDLIKLTASRLKIDTWVLIRKAVERGLKSAKLPLMLTSRKVQPIKGKNDFDSPRKMKWTLGQWERIETAAQREEVTTGEIIRTACLIGLAAISKKLK